MAVWRLSSAQRDNDCVLHLSKSLSSAALVSCRCSIKLADLAIVVRPIPSEVNFANFDLEIVHFILRSRPK